MSRRELTLALSQRMVPAVYWKMTLLSELEEFVQKHRACGTLAGDADSATLQGYRLWLICSCGATFERWVTPQVAEEDMLPRN